MGSVTRPGIEGWYKGLAKPAWTPPNAVFPIAWTVLYTLMGAAAYYANAAGVGALAMKWYQIQLVLNLAWSPIFFLGKDLTLALVSILALDHFALKTGRAFAGASDRAGKLWAPYVAWLAYATALTVALWIKNPSARAGPWRGGRSVSRRRAA